MTVAPSPAVFASATPDGDVVPVRRGHTTTVAIDDKTALYDEDDHALLVLNVSAASVWEHCDGRRRFDEIVAALSERYDADGVSLRADAWETVCKLASLGLIADGRDASAHASNVDA